METRGNGRRKGHEVAICFSMLPVPATTTKRKKNEKTVSQKANRRNLNERNFIKFKTSQQRPRRHRQPRGPAGSSQRLPGREGEGTGGKEAGREREKEELERVLRFSCFDEEFASSPSLLLSLLLSSPLFQRGDDGSLRNRGMRRSPFLSCFAPRHLVSPPRAKESVRGLLWEPKRGQRKGRERPQSVYCFVCFRRRSTATAARSIGGAEARLQSLCSFFFLLSNSPFAVEALRPSRPLRHSRPEQCSAFGAREKEYG